MKRAVRLYGELGKRFGRTHRLNVRTPAEAVRALCANYPGFETHLIESGKRNVGFRVITGGAALARAEDVSLPASGEIKIIPALVGAGGDGIGQVLLGVALIGASFLIPPIGLIGSTTLGGIVFNAGVALALGGVAQMLSPPPTQPKPKERPENEPSYTFNGPVNTSSQGQPVPVLYGELIVGGAVISAGIRVDQLKGGFSRTKEEKTREVAFYQSTGNLAVATDPSFGSIPNNWFKREFDRVETVLAPITEVPVDVNVYIYSYYEWTVVPYEDA